MLDRVPTAPGETLREKYLKPLGISQEAFARHLGISRKTVNGIISGKSRITAAIALLLADALGTPPEQWLDLQCDLDLYQAEHAEGRRRITRLDRHQRAAELAHEIAAVTARTMALEDQSEGVSRDDLEAELRKRLLSSGKLW
jgi:addiction module HigA family antidote